MTTRKPVLITTTNLYGGGIPVLVVLADDGSMWTGAVNADLTVQQWTQLRDLPQEEG